MKTTLTLISRISSRLIGSTGLRNLPVPSPKALLLALILGPAMLIALHSFQNHAAHANTHASAPEIDEPAAIHKLEIASDPSKWYYSIFGDSIEYKAYEPSDLNENTGDTGLSPAGPASQSPHSRPPQPERTQSTIGLG